MADSVCHTPSIFSMTSQTEILSTGTSYFLKQIFFLSHFIQCYKKLLRLPLDTKNTDMNENRNFGLIETLSLTVISLARLLSHPTPKFTKRLR